MTLFKINVSLFLNMFNESNNKGVQMLDSIYQLAQKLL